MKKPIISLSFICFLSTALFAESNTSGKVFFNHSTDLSEDGINAFNIKRAYLTLDNDVSKSVSYKVTYDMGSNDSGSAHTAFLKIAMVKWKTNLGNMMIGMQGMNMFKTMENTWGHRFIAKMPMDTYKYSAPADLGIGILAINRCPHVFSMVLNMFIPCIPIIIFPRLVFHFTIAIFRNAVCALPLSLLPIS
jgi:hypothetical protein